ncbi:MAG TPA: agmatinase [Acidobacteriota bacterium]|nr:agmatinase [Acidobacteriota bacterium]
MIGLIGLPFDKNSSYIRGSAKGPPEIRKAFWSESSNSWSENGIDLSKNGVIQDAGDLDANHQDEFNEIQRAISQLLEKNLNPVCLGGDHSVTYPILRAVAKKYPKLGVLHFDAHPDIYQDFQGNPYSHASPFARALEEKLIQRLVQVGIRASNSHQREQIQKYGVESHEMKDWHDNMVFEFDTPVYISFDLDGLDPSCAPGVSHPEGGGLTVRQAVQIIQRMKAKVIGADIVELNPDKDPLGITAASTAKILKEICGKILT